MACIGFTEYTISKPLELDTDTLIDSDLIRKQLFSRDDVIVLEEYKSSLEVAQDDLKPTVKMVSRGLPREVSGEFKSYLPYHLITNKSSMAYHLQTIAWTDGFGFRRLCDDYMVALGSYYSTNLGDRFRITFDTGKSINVVLSDTKQDVHTDSKNQFNPFNDNICEFIVDVKILHPMAKKMGDVSYGNDELKGGIKSIEEILE